MIKKILVVIGTVVAVVVLGFAIVVARQPNEYRIARSAKMSAPPDAVFEQVNDLHKWQEWSPWAKLDPQAKATFEGPDSGEGAIFKWSGNDEVGEGSMTITESKPSELVRFNLAFVKPMQGVSQSEFTFKPDGAGTQVTWAMSGQNNFAGKAFCLLMNMDKMMGSKFDEGLASLKAIVEKPPAAEPASGDSPTPTETEPPVTSEESR